jgi:polyribonucleotide nucleotidyltransferase
VRTGVLPRAHGSTLFTCGETQALVTATLGTHRHVQVIDALEGERRESFLFQCNALPYCVGEIGFMGSPSRRASGHGHFAKRGVQAVVPGIADFPYTIRVVSEITESNGSSSMVSICGSSLAMMDAGVPLKAQVAGVAMGLIKEGEYYAVLTDITEDEDRVGDMDFKVAGTYAGVTTIQMNMKIEGVTTDILRRALVQAHEARMHVLACMNAVLAAPRSNVSTFAPRYITFKIDPKKIRDLVGTGGTTIRALSELTGANIDLEDDGTVRVAAVDATAVADARRQIEQLLVDVEPGQVYRVRVAKLTDFRYLST